ncbi:MAG TPA: 2-oxoacid:acceptor oxidoreductase subunit alpha [Atribacteraceae bacterium]|nr:2-oxoacid:acceptor oxidoreductase subunit alpha [Atribacteraceae bacterium]
MVDYSIKIGGEAGQGVQTVADSLSRIFLRSGLQVFTIQDYQSRIRGGHSFTQIRLSDAPLCAMRKEVDMLVCLDSATCRIHAGEVSERGLVLGALDQSDPSYSRSVISLDFAAIAKEAGNPIYANIVAVGAVLGILGFGINLMEEYLSEVFRKKGDQVIRENNNALRKGFQRAQELYGQALLPDIQQNRDHSSVLLNGNDALGLGVVLAGCTFYSAYPMTPSSGVLNFVAGRAKEYGILVEQAEDEIAAVNMAVGASYCGARAMTGTSGGGFCLMTEGLGLAAMTETPLVILNAQRPGPSTGLPTRTSQGDLEFVIHASHDEFPRFVLAPGEPREAMNAVIRAFNLTERFQVPVILLSDQYLADTEWTYPDLQVDEKADSPHTVLAVQGYRRYVPTENGVSPRALPGSGPGLVIADSDEHDEWGHITEDLTIRLSQQEKRMRKIQFMKSAMRSPRCLEGEDVTLIGWGSTYGVLYEVRNNLREKGMRAGLVHFTDLYPMATETVELARNLPNPVVVEGNYLGQFARLLERETGRAFPRRVNAFNGLPFFVEELEMRIKEILS